MIKILLVGFFFTGSTDGKIHFWNTETGAKVAVLSYEATGPVQCIQFNPKYMMMATACTNMVSLLALPLLQLFMVMLGFINVNFKGFLLMQIFVQIQ